MNELIKTPPPPYYACIFTSIRGKNDLNYSQTMETMVALAQKQPGFLGMESARNEIGITVSYWQDLKSIQLWKNNTEHKLAQKHGQTKWYQDYNVRICKVEKEYYKP